MIKNKRLSGEPRAHRWQKGTYGQKENKYDVDIPKEVLDAFARYIIPEIRRFHEREEGQAFYKEWLEKHPEYAEK